LFWAIDLKFGLTDTISNVKFCEFLYSRSQINSSSIELPNNINNPCYFTVPSLIHNNIANIKMKDLVHYFRSELLVFDLEKKNGILFNLPDILQCGMIGISGIANTYRDLWKLLDNSLNLLKTQIFPKDSKQFLQDDFRSDGVDINDVFGRVKMIYKNILKEK
jgi:hypothetical protein